MREERHYEDIIGLSHHGSRRHRRMSMSDRAAQFAPFAALSGYEAAVRETERRTETEPGPDEEREGQLDRQLNRLLQQLALRPFVRIVLFEPDGKKTGGAYRSVAGRVRRIDGVRRVVELTDRTVIPIDRIHDLQLEEN